MASPMRATTECKAIPRRVLISDPADIPCSYSSTPGGTLYSTTPGGTKIVYERSFLMNMRNSPLARTPPSWEIPDNLIKGSPNGPTKKPKKANNRCPISKRNGHKGSIDDDEQFQLEL